MSVIVKVTKEINLKKLALELKDLGFYKVSLLKNKWVRVDDGSDSDLESITNLINSHSPGLSWGDIIKTRNSLLRESDFSILPDVPFTYNEREAWLNYRQSLRDIPQNFDMPDSVIWPEKPV